MFQCFYLIIDEFGPWDRFQALLTALKTVGDKHGVSLSAVATRWVLDQPQVAAGIVGARYARHLPQTLQTFAFALDEEDHVTLNAVLNQADGPKGDVYLLEGDRSSRHGRIMKYNLNTNPNDAVHGSHG